MSRIWLIDGKAFDSARWRKFIRESLKDMRVFLEDLNAILNDDGTFSISGFEKTGDGGLKRIEEDVRSSYESEPLYGINRGALVGQTLAPDGYDKYVLESFELPEEERYSKFDMLYTAAVQGDGDSLQDSWAMIPDKAKLVYTLHMWERVQKRKLAPEIWGAVLYLSWPHGKVGSMLFRANLGEKEVVKMFALATKNLLMTPYDLEKFNSLPSEVTVWRGVSSSSKYRERGFSWTLDRERAEWFSLVNAHEGKATILEARVKRASVMMYSSFEDEIVINPSMPPLAVMKQQVDKMNPPNRMSELHELLAAKDKAKKVAFD